MHCLPDDVLYVIFSYCDIATLGKLSQVCKKFHYLASSDCLWLSEGRQCLITNQLSNGMRLRSCFSLTAKEKCRIALNWKKGKCKRIQLLSQRQRYMPWLQMNSRILWVSRGEHILSFNHMKSGITPRTPQHTLTGHSGDVCRFVANDGFVISGGSEGNIMGWQASTGALAFNARDSHCGEVNTIDFNGNTVVSGSRDRTVKVWNLDGVRISEKHKLTFQDRVWSVALSPASDSFVCGTGGCFEHPLKHYDLQSGELLQQLGNNYSHGAGILHAVYETPFQLLTCGYDTYIRMWDTRCAQCVGTWENLYDLAIYCLASDHNNAFVSGSSSHGLVLLWDKRATNPIQKHYVGSGNSSVYSVTFDPCHLYVSLDRALYLLNFHEHIT